MLCSHPGASVSPVPVGLVPLAIRKELTNLNKNMRSLYSGTHAQSLRFCRLFFPIALNRDFLRALLIPVLFEGKRRGVFIPSLPGIASEKNPEAIIPP